MGGSTNRIFDDETESLTSYEGLVESRPGSPDTRMSLKPHMVDSRSLEVVTDEAVPDVVYVVEYLGLAGRVLDTLKSTEPFEEIPTFKDHKVPQENTRKPILEIVTQVQTRSFQQTLRRPRIPPPPPRHPMAHPDEYYSSDEDFNNPNPRNDVGPVLVPVMKIHSQHIIHALQAVVKYYPYVNIAGKEISIEAPYKILYHHRKELEEFKLNQPVCHDPEYHDTMVKHIDVLLDFLESNLGDKIQEEEERHRRDVPVATFEHFWLLLKPGKIIMTQKNDIWRPYIVSNVTRPTVANGLPPPYQVVCWSLSCTGAKVTRKMSRHSVYPWNGEAPIDTLDVVPAEFFRDDLNAQLGMPIVEYQTHLGRMYWNLLQRPAYMDYDGMLVHGDFDQGNNPINYRGPSGYMTGRVVVDAEGFFKNIWSSPEMNRGPGHRGPPPPPQGMVHYDHLPQYETRCGCDPCSKAAVKLPKVPLYLGFDGADPHGDSPPDSELFYTVLSPTIPAFILGDRRWGTVNLANLHPVKTDREAFKWLVLEEDTKTMIKALISKFSNSDGVAEGKIAPWANDFVKNKGEGRIFLLHGSPGVGKTCTAEAIAEVTGRPLIALTSGDLSTHEYNVEQNLSYFLRLGQRYGALVLLDEADVYLERRHSQDISRNGLVSIFLRALEYYRGVLFLTTNRVQTFDPAFTSRIHVALHYKPLTNADRERIWSNNFERLDRDSKGKVHVSASVREYAYVGREVAALRWNGREIRNAMQTAVALAETEAKDEGCQRITVTDKHLRAVVKMSKGFKDYLKKGHGWDDLRSDVVEDDDDSESDSLMDD